MKYCLCESRERPASRVGPYPLFEELSDLLPALSKLYRTLHGAPQEEK